MSDDDVTTAAAQIAESTQLAVSGSRDSLLSNQQSQQQGGRQATGDVMAAVRSLERRVTSLAGQTARLARRITDSPSPAVYVKLISPGSSILPQRQEPTLAPPTRTNPTNLGSRV